MPVEKPGDGLTPVPRPKVEVSPVADVLYFSRRQWSIQPIDLGPGNRAQRTGLTDKTSNNKAQGFVNPP